MSDWEQFLDEVPWFLGPGDGAEVGEPRPWARGPIEDLPVLSALLTAATVTPVSIGASDLELLAWGSASQRRGWLCHPPRDPSGGRMAQAHRSIWRVCGGIVERFGEPDTWWTNQNEVLTLEATHLSVADVLNDYAWLWEDAGLEISIEPGDYYAVAVEANGNLTLAHREDGHLLLFAPDHDFAGVTPLVGCPPYSLFTIDDVPDLATWVEACSAVWRDQ